MQKGKIAMKKSRIFALLLAALLVVTAICACLSVSAESTNLAKGKSYTGAVVSTHDAVKCYNANLTDDKYENMKMSYQDGVDEWFCFYYNPEAKGEGNNNATPVDGKNVGEMTIDLEALSSVESVKIHFNKDYMNATVKVEVSEDGETFTPASEKAVANGDGEQSGDWGRWVELKDQTLNGRYVKISFTFTGLFCIFNEVQVYGTAAAPGTSTDSTSGTDSSSTSGAGSTSTSGTDSSNTSGAGSTSTPSTSTPASSAPASSTTPPATGDAGLIGFAVLAVVAVSGVAIATKVRH